MQDAHQAVSQLAQCGLVTGIGNWIVVGLAVGITVWLVVKFLPRLMGGFVIGLAESESRHQGPFGSWRNDRVFGLAFGLMIELGIGLMFVLLGRGFDFQDRRWVSTAKLWSPLVAK
jgi:hypothetical protein